MARFLSCFTLSVFTLSILACAGDEEALIDDPIDWQDFDATPEGEYVAPQPVPEWYEALSGEELYREAKFREADLPDEGVALDPEGETARKRLTIDLMMGYGTLAFGSSSRRPEMPAAEVDFKRLWEIKAKKEFDGIDPVVERFASRVEFRKYGYEYAVALTGKWKLRGFDVEKPYGGQNRKGKEPYACFALQNDEQGDGPHRYGITYDGQLIRSLLAPGDPISVLWTRRLAEINSVFECIEEGVPRKDALTAYEMFAELGDETQAKLMASEVASDTLERFHSYQGDEYVTAEDGGAYFAFVNWDVKVFDEAVGWYTKAGLDKTAICAELTRQQVFESLEQSEAWASALHVYTYCGDEVNASRMRALVRP